ncbi:uncharacterized protein [Nicotiana sylvestris]|uniref:uncharacterized protein n=1 Tax=Nicotiana sylvestris TaxID=4096 RepID=UPI00388C3894
MGVFIFVTLRLFHGGVLEVVCGEPRYVGGVMTEYVNVDVDTLSYFELVDYIKELGYSSNCTFSVRPPNCGIIENINNDREHMGVEESGSAFNKGDETIETSASQNIEVGEEALNGAAATSPTPTDSAADPASSPPNPDPDSSSTEEESDKSSEDSSSDEDSDFFGDDIEDYGSDIHEEFLEFRAERKSFQRRKRKERAHADPENVPCGVAGPDLGFDETETGKKRLEGRIGGDEPYYPSSDACSFETDEDESWVEDGEEVSVNLPRRRSSTKKVVYDPTAKKVVWQL